MPQPVYNHGWFKYKNRDYWKNDFSLLCKYQPGMILYEKENYYKLTIQEILHERVEYSFTKIGDDTFDWKKKSKLFMPRILARKFYLIKNIRVERIQNISEEDAIMEGIRQPNNIGDAQWFAPILDFKKLWDVINKKRGYSWESNPWVWVIDFVKIE